MKLASTTCLCTAGLLFSLALSTRAQSFQKLKEFTDLNQAAPEGAVAVSGGMIYGTTYADGSKNYGMIFRMATNGSSYLTLKNFQGTDGMYPVGNLLLLQGLTLYGTAILGGTNYGGVVFKMNTDGSSYTVMKHFLTNSPTSGSMPFGGLVISGSTLYGMTAQGGTHDLGTVYKINTDGTGYEILKSFNGDDGAGPEGGLVLSGDTLYGATYQGGAANLGTIFRMNTNGGNFLTLKSFDESGFEGLQPYSTLVLHGNMLYGTTSQGGTGADSGTIFQINTDGGDFLTLKNFQGSDGYFPPSGLTLVGNVLYGVTEIGGSAGYGEIFQINTDGTGFAVTHNFLGLDGKNPIATPTLYSNVLYGSTGNGGSTGGGTVYALTVPANSGNANKITPLALNNGQIQLDYAGNSGSNYVLEQTLTLMSPAWTPVSTNSAGSDGNVHFTNTITATNAYWRIRSMP